MCHCLNIIKCLTVILLNVLYSVRSDSNVTDPQLIESALYNQSDIYIKEMEDIFKNESKVLFKEHIENFKLEMGNEIHNIEYFIVKEYDTMIDSINRTVHENKTDIIEKLTNAKLHALESYKKIKDKFRHVVDNIENNVESHNFGHRTFDYIKRSFHEIAVLLKLSKKDPNNSGEPQDESVQQKEQQQILQQMPIVNYFPQLSNVGL